MGAKRRTISTVCVGLLLATCLSGVSKADTDILVSTGSAWKYNDTGTDLHSAGWPAVSDSGWSQGPAPLGYGDSHQVTILNDGGATRFTCYYFRRSFTVVDPDKYESLRLRILRDDGCIVYLNGVELARSNMPSGSVGYDTFSSSVVGGTDETTYFEFTVGPEALTAGTNVLAAEVHQCNSTSSDLGFDLELSGYWDPYSPDVPLLVRPSDGATDVSTSPTLEVTVSDPDAELLDVSFFGRAAGSSGQPFSIVVLPDTQYYSQLYPEIFVAQTTWIAGNIGTWAIRFVAHEGDIVQNADIESEWQNAVAAMGILDPALISEPGEPVVAYGVLPGNHDQPTTLYNQYFPYTLYEGRIWYGGHYPAEGNDNSYQLFSGGGLDFLVLHLGYNPPSDVITWADGVLKANADRVAIIVTHAYMDGSGNILSEGQAIRNTLVAGNDNVYFVLCGHIHAEYARTDVINGREVHQLLADYQSLSNGGDGYLRIMEFVPGDNMVYVKTYSPYVPGYQTDGNSQFSLSFPMETYSLIGTASDVPSGSNASVVWSSLATQTEHEWFVEVTDTTNRTTSGPIWGFTTGLSLKASDPNPYDGAIQVPVDAWLTWSPGSTADSHDVYFGTAADSLIYQGTQPLGSESFNPDLAGDTTYYWRIDAVAGATVYTGNVWSFTTINQAPVAGDDSYGMFEDEILDVAAPGVLGNDTDAEGDPLTAVLAGGPSNGSLTLNPDGSFMYTPAVNFFGIDSFTYVANDGTSNSNTATVTITVTGVNDAPVAGDDSYTVTQDTLLSVAGDDGVLVNDSDADGDVLFAVPVAGPSHGLLDLGSDGSFIYTPDAGYYGADSFTYQAYDGLPGSNVATVSITIEAVNYDAYVGQEPSVAYGLVAGSYEGTLAQGDGNVQSISESPNGQAGMASLQADYVLSTTADRAAVTVLELHLAASWTNADPDDPLAVFILKGGGWEDISGQILPDGLFTPDEVGGTPQDYIDASGTIVVRFADTAPIRKETKDTLTIDLLYARILTGPADNPPSVSIVDPTEAQTVSGVYRVLVSAVDDSGLTSVELSIDGGGYMDISANIDGAYYYYDWDTTAADEGSHTLQARATDDAVQVTESTVVNVTVDNIPSDDPPTAAILSPADGSTVSGTVVIQVDAQDDNDPVGTLAVDVSIDGGAWTPATYNGTTGHYELNWDTAASTDGPHTIDAQATDSASQVGSAPTTNVTVNNAGPVLMSVDSVAVAVQPARQAGKNLFVSAQAVVSIVDAGGGPVAGATVYGSWSGATSDAEIGVTDANGQVTFTSDEVKNPASGATFTFTVTDVTKTAWLWDGVQNSGSATY